MTEQEAVDPGRQRGRGCLITEQAAVWEPAAPFGAGSRSSLEGKRKQGSISRWSRWTEGGRKSGRGQYATYRSCIHRSWNIASVGGGAGAVRVDRMGPASFVAKDKVDAAAFSCVH